MLMRYYERQSHDNRKLILALTSGLRLTIIAWREDIFFSLILQNRGHFDKS